jgi:hypothetical protein
MEARRALEQTTRQKQAPGAPANKMLPGPPENKGNPAKIAPSERPELAGVRFASAPARVQAESAGLTAKDFSEEAKRRGVTARDVHQALERRATP